MFEEIQALREMLREALKERDEARSVASKLQAAMDVNPPEVSEAVETMLSWDLT